MPKNTKSINSSLFKLLKSHGYNPKPLDASGKKIPVSDDADVFQFTVKTDHSGTDDASQSRAGSNKKHKSNGAEKATVTVSIDDNHDLKVYYDNDASGDDNWYNLLRHLKKFAVRNQLGFEPSDQDQLSYDMAKRLESNLSKLKEAREDDTKASDRHSAKLAEGYFSAGKRASWSDAVPSVKILVQHTRPIEDGEQRFRNVDRIFIENVDGERILAPTKNTAAARLFARVIAEGDKPHGERWEHIKSLLEEYTGIRGFIKATRGRSFNESVERLVSESVSYHSSLRETLHKISTHRGYHNYFETWSPTLLEGGVDTSSVEQILGEELLSDSRVMEAIGILGKINRNIAENASIKEVDELSEWATSIIDETVDGDIFTEVSESRQDALDSDGNNGTKHVNSGKKKSNEGITVQQKKAGQLGPTERVRKNSGARGKLVGADESVEKTTKKVK